MTDLELDALAAEIERQEKDFLYLRIHRKNARLLAAALRLADHYLAADDAILADPLKPFDHGPWATKATALLLACRKARGNS